jgi:hypothetical protein
MTVPVALPHEAGVNGKEETVVHPKVPLFQLSAWVLELQDESDAPKSLVVEAVPVLSTVKSVVVEKTPPRLVVEPMAKSMVLVEDAALPMESEANGVEVPIPTLPLARKVVDAIVDDAFDMRPFWKPMTVPVALPHEAGVNGNGGGV